MNILKLEDLKDEEGDASSSTDDKTGDTAANLSEEWRKKLL